MARHPHSLCTILCGIVTLSFLSACLTPLPSSPPVDIQTVDRTLGGDTLSRARIMQGGLVKTMQLDDGRSINVQINKEDVPKNEALYSRTMTIGAFSKILGSGFTKKKDLAFKKRIGNIGQDTFTLDGIIYQVTWRRDNWDVTSLLVSDIYTVVMRRAPDDK